MFKLRFLETPMGFKLREHFEKPPLTSKASVSSNSVKDQTAFTLVNLFQSDT